MAVVSQRLVVVVGLAVFGLWATAVVVLLTTWGPAESEARPPLRRAAPEVYRPPKLAFLFLVRSSIPTAPIWEAFFREGGFAMKGRYSIYSHPRPGYRLSGFFAGSEIINRTKVSWGAITVARAEMLLLRAALEDPSNARFLLVSESCVPVHPLRCTYDFAMSVPAMVATWATTERATLYDFGPLDALVKRRWRKGHQWVLLSRREAVAAADESWYLRFARAHASSAAAAEFRLKYHQQTGKKDGDSIHHNFADEHYVQTALALGDLETSGVVAASPTLIRFGDLDRRRRLLDLDVNKPMQRDWRATTYDPVHIRPGLFRLARALCLYDLACPRASSDDDPRTPQNLVAPWDPTTPQLPECLFNAGRPSLCHLTLRKVPNRTVATYLAALWG